jgi:hypothetical protein
LNASRSIKSAANTPRFFNIGQYQMMQAKSKKSIRQRGLRGKRTRRFLALKRTLRGPFKTWTDESSPLITARDGDRM